MAESWVGYLADYLADPTVGRWAGPSVPEKVETMAANSVDWTVESLAVWWVGLKAALMEWRTAAGTVVLSAELWAGSRAAWKAGRWAGTWVATMAKKSAVWRAGP